MYAPSPFLLYSRYKLLNALNYLKDESRLDQFSFLFPPTSMTSIPSYLMPHDYIIMTEVYLTPPHPHPATSPERSSCPCPYKYQVTMTSSSVTYQLQP